MGKKKEPEPIIRLRWYDLPTKMAIRRLKKVVSKIEPNLRDMSRQDEYKTKVLQSVLQYNEIFEIESDNGEPLTTADIQQLSYTELLELFYEGLEKLDKIK